MNFMGDLFTFGSLHTFSSLSFGVESCGFAVPAFFLSEKKHILWPPKCKLWGAGHTTVMRVPAPQAASAAVSLAALKFHSKLLLTWEL